MKPELKKTTHDRMKDFVELPRGNNPESTMQQDHLLISALKTIVAKALWLDEEDAYVMYSAGYEPEVQIHFIVNNLESDQIRMLHDLLPWKQGTDAADGAPVIEVEVFTTYIDYDTANTYEYVGQFEVRITVRYHADEWNRIVAHKHVAAPSRKKMQKPKRKK